MIEDKQRNHPTDPDFDSLEADYLADPYPCFDRLRVVDAPTPGSPPLAAGAEFPIQRERAIPGSARTVGGMDNVRSLRFVRSEKHEGETRADTASIESGKRGGETIREEKVEALRLTTPGERRRVF